MLDRKSLSRAIDAQHTREQFSTKLSLGEYAHGLDNPLPQQLISHPERLLTGLTTRLFDRKTMITTPKLLTSFYV
jgi:hypothetical protein